MTKKSQKSGDNSTNIQAEEVNIKQGLDYSEVKEVALDVFRSNFYELSGIAKETARERAETITEDFLRKLNDENPSGFKKAEDPDFQHALFTIQKEYARNGDEQLGDLLVDLLVDRSKQEQRDILQIVLNESLNIAPKLTNEQLAALSVIFLFRYTVNHGIGNIETLGLFFDKHVKPFAKRLVKGAPCYQHLQFTSCGSISLGSQPIEKIISSNYQGLFMKGFEPEEIGKSNLELNTGLFINCLNDNSKIQVNALNENSLKSLVESKGLAGEQEKSLKDFFNKNKMSDKEIRKKCVQTRDYMKNVFDVWENSHMKNFTLTSVGIAIGHANIKRLIGEFSDLSIWIN